MKYPQTFQVNLDPDTADRLCIAVLRDWKKMCASSKSKHPDDRATDKKVYKACKTLIEFWS